MSKKFFFEKGGGRMGEDMTISKKISFFFKKGRENGGAALGDDTDAYSI